MKRYTLFCVCGLLLLVSARIVHGQGFTGPGAVAGLFPSQAQGQPVMIAHPITVSEARNLPHDSWVVLTGNIVNALPGGKFYTFRDASGEIPVDIGMKHWRGLSVSASDRVVLYGEVKINRGQATMKVHAMTGPGSVNVRQGQPVMAGSVTVGEARTLPHDSFVMLTGNIVGSLSGNNYIFRDSSGDITVDIGSKHWRGLSVSASDTVVLYGEVKIKSRQVSIKVHAIRKA